MEANIDRAARARQAVALRLAGLSRREIMEILGPMSNSTLNDALRGTPPPEWTLRPRARDDLHEEARRLRGEGLSYDQIAKRLGVSKSSVSLWVRDLPRPAHLSPEESRKRTTAGVRRYWEREYAHRDEFRAAAGRQIGELTDREVRSYVGMRTRSCFSSRSRIRTCVERTKTVCPARLDDPGLLPSTLPGSEPPLAAYWRRSREAGSELLNHSE